MNKKNIILLSLLVILVAFIIFITVYKFKFSSKNKEKYYFTWTSVERKKENNYSNDNLDKDKYDDYIIKENNLKIEYTFFDSENSIKGQVYIGTDKYLYISDINRDLIYRASTNKFRTMYTKSIHYDEGIYIYLISEDNKLYSLELTSNDITKAALNQINTSMEVMNFVDLEFLKDINDTPNTLFVLANDGNIYDIASKIRYNENIKILYNNLYVFNDNTMTNEYGKILESSDNTPYKIKYIFQTYDDNKFSGKNTKIIITEDNKLLYIENEIDYVYQFNKSVKDINFNVYYPYIKGNLKLTFDDDSFVELSAECNQYFCVNYSEE